MKLIDILVQELPKRGGWPAGIEEIWQDYDGLIRPGGFGWYHDQIAEDHRRKHEDAHVKIHRKKYEAALAASKTGWDGDGLPPIGKKFEFSSSAGWMSAVMKYCGESFAIIVLNGSETWLKLDGVKFRPIRSEADKRRDEAIESITSLIEYRNGCHAKALAGWLFEEIVFGKIPHIRID